MEYDHEDEPMVPAPNEGVCVFPRNMGCLRIEPFLLKLRVAAVVEATGVESASTRHFTFVLVSNVRMGDN